MRANLLILLSLIFAFASPAKAQALFGLDKDSLRHIAASTPDDSLKVATLIYLGQQYENNQPDSAVYFYQKAGSLSRKLNYHDGYIRYVSNYTAILNVRGKFDESLQLNLQTIDTCQKYHLGNINYTRALVNTGNVYELIGDHASSAAYYLKALPIVETSGDTQRLSTVYNNLSGLYRSLHQMPGALDYSRKALDLAEKSQDLFSAGSACINLGNTLKDLNRIDEGARYIERAYAIGHQLHDSNMMETALIDIGDTYLRKGKPDKYIPVYQKALGLARTLGDVSGQAFGMQGLAYGLFYKSQYPAAEAFLKQAIPFARDNDQKEVWRGLLLLMSDVQAVLGNLDAYHRYRDLSDSVSNAIVNESLLKNVQELETKYKVEKQQHDLLKKDLLLAEKDKAAVQQHNWLIAAIAGILLLGILVVMIWLISRQQQQLQSRTIRALEAEQENVRLKAMLEGQQQERQRISQEMHDDMGSGLTSLLFLSRALDPAGNETALKMNRTAEQLIRKMNEIIWSMNPEQDTLDNLLAYIRTNTAELLEYAGIDFRFDIREPAQKIKVNSEFRRNIYLVAKEAVHNIVRHSGASRVVISILVEDMKLEITVRDNGKGFDPATNSRFGNGLKNMRRRMEQINGEIDFDRDGGAIVSIRAPLGPV